MRIQYFVRLIGRSLAILFAVPCLIFCLIGYGGSIRAAWMTEIVDSVGDVGQSPSLAFDSNNIPHVSYYDASTDADDLKYAFKTTSWRREIVDAEGDAGISNDLAIDPNSVQPCIVYFERSGNILKYATHDSFGWHIEILYDALTKEGTGVSLDFGVVGNPHISFASFDSNSYNLCHVVHIGSYWNLETLEYGSVDGSGIQTRIEADQTDFYHLVYFVRALDGGTLRYAYGQNLSPPVALENIVSYLGDSGGFGLDLLGQVHPEVSYHDSPHENLNFAIRSGAWVPETIDSVASADVQNSIRIDTLGNAHVAFYSGPSGTLKYAYHDSNGWSVSTVDGIEGCGAYPSLALGISNQPGIAYYDTAQGNLKYAWFETGSCTTTSVDVTMPANIYHSGDLCYCKAIVCNGESQNLSGYPLFVILDILDSLYFAPSFSKYDNYLFRYPEFSTGGTIVEVLPEFIWPDGVAPMNGLIWYAALTDPDITQIYGEMGTFTFGWE